MAEVGDTLLQLNEVFIEKKKIKYSLQRKVVFFALALCIFLMVGVLFIKLSFSRKDGVENFCVSAVKKEKANFTASSLREYAEVVAEYWKSKNSEVKEQLNFEVGRVKHEKLVDPTSMTAIQEKDHPTVSHKHGFISTVFFQVGQVNQRNLVDPTSMEPRPEKHHEIISHKHGFISTVLTAYSQHLALVLSPDDFWLLISLGIGQFLGGNPEMAEKYRYTFVNHTGKKELVVWVDKYGITPKNPHSNGEGWPMAIEEMTELIKKETATNISTIMTDPFSTTGFVEQTVMRTTLMETMKNYFQYSFNILCGIPEIALEGNASDYQSLIDRVDELTGIFPDFAWYLNRVHKHLVKIYETKTGDVDDDWWRNMVVYTPPKHVGCGFEPGSFTGWLTDFIAFTGGRDGEMVNNNGAWETMDFEDCNTPAVTMTDFILNDNGRKYKMVLTGGFVGVALDEKRVDAVRPAIGWMTFYKE